MQDGDFRVSGVTLNESPSEKEGKSTDRAHRQGLEGPLNESPSEKEGKFDSVAAPGAKIRGPSMKVPPKRKGNKIAVGLPLRFGAPQ